MPVFIRLLSLATIPKACGPSTTLRTNFEAATLRVAGVSPARPVGILPAVENNPLGVTILE
jgi:hypothetical protein